MSDVKGDFHVTNPHGCTTALRGKQDRELPPGLSVDCTQTPLKHDDEVKAKPDDHTLRSTQFVSHFGECSEDLEATAGNVETDDEDSMTQEFQPPIVRTILFVDDDDVSQRSGTVRSLHPPARHGSPVLVGDRPWEKDVLNQSQLLYSTVVQEEDGTFKVWYNSYPALDGKESLVGLVCFAESTDGLSWVKPSLGLVSWNGSTDNNIVVAAPNLYGAAVVVDRNVSSPQERYKLLIWSQSGYGTHPPKLNVPGMYGFTSADGKAFDPVSNGSALLIGGGVIGWEVPYEGTKHPVLCDYGKTGPYPAPPGSNADKDCYGNPSSISDVMQLFFDQSINEFVCHHKMWADGPDGRQSWRRALGRTQTVSRNFSHWLQPELVLSPDEHDEPSGGIQLPVASGGAGARIDLHGGSVWLHRRSGHYTLALMVYFFNNDEYKDPNSYKDCFTNLANRSHAIPSRLVTNSDTAHPWGCHCGLASRQEPTLPHGTRAGTWRPRGRLLSPPTMTLCGSTIMDTLTARARIISRPSVLLQCSRPATLCFAGRRWEVGWQRHPGYSEAADVK